MTRPEFATVMAYLGAACGKPLTADGHEVYYDLLGDLPLAALQLAARLALLESQYPVFPTVGVLRRLATEAAAARAFGADEAWAMVRQAVLAFGYYREREGLAALPAVVRRAVESLGWRELCDATEPEIVRAQFRRAYEAAAAREQRQALLPARVKALIGRVARDFQLEGGAA